VKRVFGEYLESRRYYEEAGFMYMGAENYGKAFELFGKAGNVEMALAAATHIKQDEG